MSKNRARGTDQNLVATGIAGLDDILDGGLARNRLYLIEGNPGSGKTTLALQCLIDGAKRGETVLYVTLSETNEELEAVAESHGWSLDGVHVMELVAKESELEPENQYAMYEPSELELGVTTSSILAEVERLKPSRLVIDSLSEMRLLAQSALRYRRQVLAMKQYFIGRGCTVFLVDDKTSEVQDLQLLSLAHGVVSLEQLSPEYGAERRRLRVKKLRGRVYRGGYHDFTIHPGGLAVFPRLIAAEHDEPDDTRVLKSGVPELDALLGGGIEFGTSALLVGPAGAGKSSVATQFAKSATDAGMRAAMFVFDERRQTLLGRSARLGIGLEAPLQAGTLTIKQVDSAELSPGEFAHEVRQVVEGTEEQEGAKVIVIDSLNGYLAAMPEERFLAAQLHELLTFLGNKGVVTFVVVAQHGLVGEQLVAPVDTTYIADAVLLFRYFEARGHVRQALSVIKKRVGEHERTIRELRLSSRGIELGAPLEAFQGILTGVPQFSGTAESLMDRANG